MQRSVFILLIFFALIMSACTALDTNGIPGIKLTRWDRGIKITSVTDTSKFAYLWFYEWHLFDAIKRGEHTPGRWDWKWQVDQAGTAAVMDSGGIKFKIKADITGADMLLSITNKSDFDWPPIAAIIPCFNPGTDRGKVTDAVANPSFFDDQYLHTWFIGEEGPALIAGKEYPREIHFNKNFLPDINNWPKESAEGSFVFSSKWPTSIRPAVHGLMIREDNDEQWIMGIAWEDFLSAQGHNPWKCMHLSVRVGPLKRNESKLIHGKIYLFKGSKADCLAQYQKDFLAK